MAKAWTKCSWLSCARLGRSPAETLSRLTAMAGNFDNVFAGERPRRAHDSQEHFVQALAIAQYMAKMECVCRRQRRLFRQFPGGRKTSVRHRERLRSRDPDNGKATLTEWCGDCGYSVFGKHGAEARLSRAAMIRI